VLLAEEVNPVIRALRESDIEVTAIHNHMLNEQPRLFFVHFWANDDAQKTSEGATSSTGEDCYGKELIRAIGIFALGRMNETVAVSDS
jgi:Domain of Unknown Function (DUF1259)